MGLPIGANPRHSALLHRNTMASADTHAPPAEEKVPARKNAFMKKMRSEINKHWVDGDSLPGAPRDVTVLMSENELRRILQSQSLHQMSPSIQVLLNLLMRDHLYEILRVAALITDPKTDRISESDICQAIERVAGKRFHGSFQMEREYCQARRDQYKKSHQKGE